jgi:hypothetical protein
MCSDILTTPVNKLEVYVLPYTYHVLPSYKLDVILGPSAVVGPISSVSIGATFAIPESHPSAPDVLTLLA